MARTQSNFVCQSCGAASSKWSGRCDACGAWNTIIEEQPAAPMSGAKGARLPTGKPTRLAGLKGKKIRVFNKAGEMFTTARLDPNVLPGVCSIPHGHVDANVNNPSENIAQWRAGHKESFQFKEAASGKDGSAWVQDWEGTLEVKGKEIVRVPAGSGGAWSVCGLGGCGGSCTISFPGG